MKTMKNLWNILKNLNEWRAEKIMEHCVCVCVCVCVCAQSLSQVWHCVTLWTVAHLAPLSMVFSRQEYWSRFPFSPPGDLPNPGIKPASPALASRFFTTMPPGKPNRDLPDQKQKPKEKRRWWSSFCPRGSCQSVWSWALVLVNVMGVKRAEARPRVHPSWE